MSKGDGGGAIRCPSPGLRVGIWKPWPLHFVRSAGREATVSGGREHDVSCDAYAIWC